DFVAQREYWDRGLRIPGNESEPALPLGHLVTLSPCHLVILRRRDRRSPHPAALRSSSGFSWAPASRFSSASAPSLATAASPSIAPRRAAPVRAALFATAARVATSRRPARCGTATPW